jgi:hypothetical protein
MLASGATCCYRFRVPPGKEIFIDDIVRGRVTWNTGGRGRNGGTHMQAQRKWPRLGKTRFHLDDPEAQAP